jgi:hypothetical protein
MTRAMIDHQIIGPNIPSNFPNILYYASIRIMTHHPHEKLTRSPEVNSSGQYDNGAQLGTNHGIKCFQTS